MIDHLVISDGGNYQPDSSDMLWRLVCSEDASLLSTLCITALVREKTQNIARGRDSLLLEHRATRALRQRLQSGKPISDALVGTIAGLAAFSVGTENPWLTQPSRSPRTEFRGRTRRVRNSLPGAVRICASQRRHRQTRPFPRLRHSLVRALLPRVPLDNAHLLQRASSQNGREMAFRALARSSEASSTPMRTHLVPPSVSGSRCEISAAAHALHEHPAGSTMEEKQARKRNSA